MLAASRIETNAILCVGHVMAGPDCQRLLASLLIWAQNEGDWLGVEDGNFFPLTWRTCRFGERSRSMVATSPELKAFLLATPFFGGLSEANLDLLIPMLVERGFEAGATVVAEGDQGSSMFVVHSGELAVSHRGDSGRVIPMSTLGPGDFFGEMTLIEMQSRSATVVAKSPSELYELTARQLYTFYKADIRAYVIVLQNINRELCRRLRRADNRFFEATGASRAQTASAGAQVDGGPAVHR